MKKYSVFLNALVMALGFLIFPNLTFAQSKISGKITANDTGELLPGVSVLIKGTTNGTSSNFDGEYTLMVSSSDILVFSFIGYKSITVPVNNQSILNIALEPDMEQLEEVVVIGYGTQKKSDLTGAVSSVDSKEITKMPVGSVTQALQGRAAGVSVVQQSGQPGSNSIIRIRGANSIQGGNDPLYIVDGFPVTEGIGTISPSDIENIEILKDASATAIYGARATNGVVIITTKKGQKGKAQLDFNMYQGVQETTRRIELMNARQFMELANERAANDGEPAFFPNPEEVAYDTDWQDEIYRTAPIKNYNLSVKGGNESFKYSLSGDYFSQDGILRGSDYERGSLRANLEGKVTNWLTISNSLLAVRTSQNNQPASGAATSPTGGALMAPPTLPITDEDGNWNEVNTYGFSPGALQNPVAPTRDPNNLNKITSTRLFDNFYAQIKFTDWLSFKSSFGIDYTTGINDRYIPRTLADGRPEGKAYTSNFERYSVLNENIVMFNKTINDHQFDAIAGYTWQTFNSRSFQASSFNFVTDDLLNNDLSAGAAPQVPTSEASDWGIASWLGRVNYILKDKYLFTVSGRADGSSRFTEGNKWAFFPSAAFAWRIINEDFMQSSTVFTDLKFRASYGKTGNQAVDPYQTWIKMESLETSLGDQLNVGYRPGNIANKELKWETTSQYNLGLDFGFLDNRLRFTADYYYKYTNDLLAQVNLPSSSGYSSVTQNIGEMQNSGFELALNSDVLTGKFQYNTSVNFWLNRNKIVKLSKGADVFGPKTDNLIPSIHILREGYPISMFYGYIKEGLDENGLTKYKDLNGDGEVNDMDRDFIGNPHPKFQYGWSNNFSYKGFDLSIFMEGAYGMDIFNAANEWVGSSFYKGGNQIVDVYHDHWTPTNTDAKYPKITANQSFRQSDAWVEDASYLKIRNINLGYTFPTNEIDWLRNARVYISLQNWFTFTNYSWYDPEVSTYGSGDLRIGVDKNTYPKARVASIGVSLGI